MANHYLKLKFLKLHFVLCSKKTRENSVKLLVRLKKKYQMMIIFAEKSSKKSEKSKFVKKILQKIPSKNGQRISSKKFVKKVLKIVKKFKKTSKN